MCCSKWSTFLTFQDRLAKAFESIREIKWQWRQSIANPSHGLWEAVQSRLRQCAIKPRGVAHGKSEGLLKGRLYDRAGNGYATSATSKKGNKKHRYYINNHLKKKRGHPLEVMARIPAKQIENLVTERIQSLLADRDWIRQVLNLKDTDDRVLSLVLAYANKNDIIADILDRVIVHEQTIDIRLSVKSLANLLSERLSLQIFGALGKLILKPYLSRHGGEIG